MNCNVGKEQNNEVEESCHGSCDHPEEVLIEESFGEEGFGQESNQEVKNGPWVGHVYVEGWPVAAHGSIRTNPIARHIVIECSHSLEEGKSFSVDGKTIEVELVNPTVEGWLISGKMN